MKNTITFFLLIISYLANAQVVMEIPNDGVLYLEIENILTITKNKSNCKRLKIETDNGRLTRSESCEFIYKAEKSGKVKFKIYKKRLIGFKLIQTRVFRVKNIADSTSLHVYLNSHPSFSKVSKSELLISEGIHIMFSSSVHNLNAMFKINKYDITLISESGNKTIHNQGNRFSEDVQSEVSKLKKNDIIIFDNIETTLIDSSIVRCEPLVIYVA